MTDFYYIFPIFPLIETNHQVKLVALVECIT